jgi:DNA repair exonuclease SbcCD ATPase subunit
MAFGNNETYIDLTKPNTFEIVGENFDVPTLRNGTGKTTILNVICYALYGSPLSKIKMSNLMNLTNASQKVAMETTINFSVDSVEYQLYRSRGGSNQFSLQREGVDITPGKSVTELDNMVANLLGMSYEVFTKTIVFSGDSIPFLDLPASQQRAFVEEIFNIGLLSEKAARLKDRIKNTESDLKVQEAVVAQQRTAVTHHEKQVKEAQLRVDKWYKDTLTEIDKLTTQLTSAEIEVDITEQQNLAKQMSDLKQKERELANQMKSLEYDFNKLDKELTQKEKELTTLQNAKCPYCEQALHDANERADKITVVIDSLTGQAQDIASQLTKLESEHTAVCASQLVIMPDIIPNLDTIIQARLSEQSTRSKLETLRQASNPHVENLDSLRATSFSVDTGKIDELQRRLTHQQFLLKLLTNKDSFIRRNIINKQLPILNDRIKTYSKKLGLPHQLKFNADMTCEVTEFGREIDFGMLSKGETKRANMALSLAFRDIAGLSKNWFNILLIDELDGGLDDSGLDAFIKVLKEKSRDEQIGVYVISHHPNIRGRLDQQMLVRKHHGFSSLIE